MDDTTDSLLVITERGLKRINVPFVVVVIFPGPFPIGKRLQVHLIMFEEVKIYYAVDENWFDHAFFAILLLE